MDYHRDEFPMGPCKGGMMTFARHGPVALAACAFIALGASAAPTSSLEGWYTSDQASAGRTRYNASCAMCHGQNLQGGAGPALTGASFGAKWRGHPLSDLYTVVHDQMPLTAPGKGVSRG